MKSILQKAGFEWLWLKQTQICKAGMFSNLQWVTPTTKEDKLQTCGMLSLMLSLLSTNKLQIWLEGSCQPLNPLMFRSLTDMQDESRDKTARWETIRHQRALMRKRVQHRSPTFLGRTSRSFVVATPAKPQCACCHSSCWAGTTIKPAKQLKLGR